MWLLAGFVKSAMEGVLFVTPMFDHARSYESAMNVTTGPTKDDVLFVVDRVFRMPITVKNARFKRRIEMGVLKLST